MGVKGLERSGEVSCGNTAAGLRPQPAKRQSSLSGILSRGYGPTHTPHCACPGCSRSHWYVGRMMAECAFCGTAIPLAPERIAA